MTDPFEYIEKNFAEAKGKVSNSGSYEDLPEGKYQMVIKDVVAEQSKAKQKWQLKWTFEVMTNQYSGRKHFTRTPLEGDYAHISLNTAAGTGLNITTSTDLREAVNGEKFTGIVVNVSISAKGNTFIDKPIEVVKETSKPAAEEDIPWD